MDKRAIRAAFERAAPHYEQAAQLQQEVARRLDERLEVMKIAPALILDAGCGTGFGVPLLRARYPEARLIGLDLALAMLKQTRARHGQARGWRAWLSRLTPHASPLTLVCGDIERLPLARDSVDLVWSNLTLQWVGDLPATLREVHRVIRPGGLFAFSTFGPDTLKELRQAFAGIDGYAHVNRFIDMHDIGDMLTGAQYADPVMDMEPFTLTYDTVRQLMRDLKAIGAHNVTGGRPQSLSGKGLLQAVTAAYEAYRRDGKLPATFEVVYGHAWKPLPRVSPTGRPVIDIAVKGS